MAYWRSKPQNIANPREIITIGDGVNKYGLEYNIEKSEAYDQRNVCSKNYPSLTVRDGFSLSFGTGATAITTPNGMGVRNASTLHVVDGTVWKAWNGSAFANVQTGLTNATATILDFNRETDTLTLLFNGTDKKAYNGTTVIDLTEAPATKLICVDDNRLYALSGKRLYYSSFSDPTDFTTLDDSGVLTLVGMKGTETAIVAYQDIVISFSDQTMHLLYGDDYENFQLMDPMQVGCISHRSIIEHNSKLYFMDYNKFQLFTGGFPTEVSQKVRGYLENINYTHKEKIVSGSHKRYIYVSIPHGSSATTNNLTLEFDTETGNWYPINRGYLNFVNIGEDLYGMGTDGKIDKLNDGTQDQGQAIVWYHETGIISSFIPSAVSTLSDIWLECKIPTGSTLTISYAENDKNTFTTLSSVTGTNSEQKSRIQVPTTLLQDADRYRLKFSGTGPCEIHFVEIQERVRVK